MAAGIAKRDTGGARESRHKRGQQQNNPDEDEDEDTTEPRRKSRRIQDSGQFLSLHTASFLDCLVSDSIAASQGRQQNPRVSSKTCRQSLRVQEKQATNQQRTARLFPTTDQLSEHNLRIFNGEINPAANNAPILERTSSSPPDLPKRRQSHLNAPLTPTAITATRTLRTPKSTSTPMRPATFRSLSTALSKPKSRTIAALNSATLPKNSTTPARN